MNFDTLAAVRSALVVAGALTLSACGTSPTTSAEPESFEQIQAGTYRPAEQARFVDCVFDGFLGAQNMAAATHVRQTKRADGWRIDVIAAAFQYVVADVKEDGRYTVTRSTYARILNFDKEQLASKACLERFGTVAMDAPMQPRGVGGPGNHLRSGL